MKNDNEQYPEGHFIGMWIGIGIALGACIGVPFGIAIGNPAFFGIGLPIGLAIGVAIGSSIEAQYKKEGKIRPLTDEEQNRKMKAVMAGIALVIIGVVALLVFLLI